jgi:hypothetical protein
MDESLDATTLLKLGKLGGLGDTVHSFSCGGITTIKTPHTHICIHSERGRSKRGFNKKQ